VRGHGGEGKNPKIAWLIIGGIGRVPGPVDIIRPGMSTKRIMDSLVTILLKPGEADRIVAGHPWLYEGSILRQTSNPNDGDVVQVKDHRQRFLGLGFFNSKSRIRVRMMTHEREDIDRAFFSRRISAALKHRRKHLSGATSYRVVNSEADLLSGLIVDLYEDVLVVQTSSMGMDQRKQQVVSVLQELLSPKAILERNDMASRKFEGLEEAQGVLAGVAPEGLTARLNGLRFQIPGVGGHKTGMYLDQQDNYEAVSRWAKDGNVLDCFSFLGGFALHAARAGARSVLGVDQSAEAIAAAKANAVANGLGEKVQFETGNVFDWLKANTTVLASEKMVPKFDLIILDPPSFTRSRAAVGDALRGYKEIHLRALKLLRPGGVLSTFCCSHHVDARLFEDVILSAAYDCRRVLRRVASYSQSPDHPILPSIPETEYLKGYAYEMVG
jgi:23S rRNA (cytosine1962-C5)-methyltransferase